MNTSIANIWARIREQFQKISPSVKRLLAVLSVIVVLFSVAVSIVLNNKPYETLFAGLNAQEASEILARLQEMGVQYKYENDGTILVTKEMEPQIKAQLVSQGYPKSGLTYDIFKSNIDMMTTDFEKNSYKIFDLQDRLASTIRMFEGVQDATVTIAIGEEQRYVLQNEKVPTTASVVVIMHNGGSPTPDQVNGIQRLVAKAVPGMEMDNVAILDGSGQDVSSSSGGALQLGSTQLKLNLEREIENSIRAKILHILSPIFGGNKVRVSVYGLVDVDKKIKEIIQYEPSEGNKGVASSENSLTEVIREGEGTGGIPGTEANSEVPVYTGVTVDGDEVYFRDEKTYNYVVSQIKEQIQSDSGVLTELMVSVAIDSASLEADKQAEIRKLVATTAGIAPDQAEDKIALFFDHFVTSDAASGEAPADPGFALPLTTAQLIMIGGGVLLLIVLLVIFLIIRGKSRRRKAQANLENIVSEAGYTADIMDIDLHNIKNTREMELKQQISEFADGNPEISAQLIRTWLKGVDDK